MTTYTATYSAEDNKLRLYASERLDAETYERARKLGFVWAPVQKLFVAPAWGVEREDFLLELAGEITAEGSTVAERAEAKAERLENLATKSAAKSDAYHAAANRISERFYMGQPILVGHHSERRARKDKERIENSLRASIKAAEAVDYWNYRARGVEVHANRKNSDRTRANRIKGLLAELRDLQRKINHGYKVMAVWEKVEAMPEGEAQDKAAIFWAGAFSDEDLLNLVVEIKGYRGEDAKIKKETMEVYWVPGVNNLGTHGRWAFAEFADVYAMQVDFAEKVKSHFNDMIERFSASKSQIKGIK